MKGFSSAVVLLGYIIVVYCQNVSRDVQIEQGIVRGYNVDADNVFSFYGIPYASAPTGPDRFKAALPPPTWIGAFEATTKTIACPQRPAYEDAGIVRTVDCLVLHVFAPNTEETNLPVYVYIHGGGFQQGFALEVSPVALVQTGIITVTINYRIGVHGFLCLGTEFAPGNVGMKDQIEALRWVQNNIAYFGGNPNDVTIGGLSAGAMSVELNMLSPMGDGLFHKLVSESGAATNNIVMTSPVAVAEEFANQFDVVTNQDVDSLELFFGSLSDEQLSVLSNTSDFSPCLENHDIEGVEKYLTELPHDIITNGNYEKRPILIGFTGMEGLNILSTFDIIQPVMQDDFQAILPDDIEFKSEEEKIEVAQRVKDLYFPTGEITYIGCVDYYSDTIFTYDIIASARSHALNSVPTYLYAFNYNGSINLPSAFNLQIWGPGHIAQSFYVLDGYYEGMYDNMSPNDQLTRERLREMWINFIKYGDPTPTQSEIVNVTWLSATPMDLYYLDIDLELTMNQSPLSDRVALWDELYGLWKQRLAQRQKCIVIF